jgi:phenylacetic acid degradation operon negative regulatory protein
MRARTEQMLYRLEWMSLAAGGVAWLPQDRALPNWVYPQGITRQLQRLEAQGQVETRKGPRGCGREVRLTESGAAAFALRADPVLRWSRVWDGAWRVVLFDVPEQARTVRARLRQRLVREEFGCLQQSVWIAADSNVDWIGEVRCAEPDVASLMMLEARTVAGDSAAAMVSQAWNFDAIGRAWNQLAVHLDRMPDDVRCDGPSSWEWIAKERELAKHCLKLDPLLPEALIPPGYPGREVWHRRQQVLARLLAEWS